MFLKMKFFKIFLLIYCTKHCRPHENKIVKSLINSLEIKNCILVDDDFQAMSSSKNLKSFAKENIYTTFMNLQLFLDYIGAGYYVNVKTAVFIKTNTMVYVFKFYFTQFNFDYVMSPFTWIIFDKVAPSLIYQLEKFYIPYNCEFIIIRQFKEEYYEVDDLHNVGLTNASQKQRHIIGFWSEGKLTMTSLSREMRRFNMNGETVMLETATFNICEQEQDCYHAEILLEIGRIMNSTLKFHWTDARINGAFPTTAAGTRSVVYDSHFFYPYMLGPTFILHGHFHIKDDVGEEYGFQTYMAPFPRTFWNRLLVTLITSSIVMFITENWKSFSRRSRKKIILSDTIWRPMETMCNQCGSKIPPHASSRLAWYSIRLPASFIVPLYSATVISFVTISIPKLPFTDLKTFLQDGTYKTSGIRDVYSHLFFTSSSDPINKEITEKLLLSSTPYSDLEGVQWMCKADFKYAFVAYNNDVFEIPNRPCKILRIPKPIFSVGTGFMMRMYSPYKGVYTRNLYQFYTSGVLHKMRKRFVRKIPENDEEDHTTLTFNHVGPLLYILAVGYIASIIILFLEILHKKKNQTLNES